jgi:hypothetical protein
VQSAKFQACAGKRLVSPGWLWRGLVSARDKTEQTNSGNVSDDRCFVPHFRCDAFQVRMQREQKTLVPARTPVQRFQ